MQGKPLKKGDQNRNSIPLTGVNQQLGREISQASSDKKGPVRKSGTIPGPGRNYQ